MIEIYKTISRVAPTRCLVLIEGETGTGKELIAQEIHKNSPRFARPFVPVDCASLAPSLIESETVRCHEGRLHRLAPGSCRRFLKPASGGTVFLDEVGEVDLNFQLKLLRFLQEKEIRPLGSNRPRKVDVRIVAATNKNLPKMVEDGKFRKTSGTASDVRSRPGAALRERPGDVQCWPRRFSNATTSAMAWMPG